MIDLMTANDALDTVGEGRSLLCFARGSDLTALDRLLAFFHNTQSTRIIRVEPTIEAAETIQISRYPMFILYEDGSECWQALGAQQLRDRSTSSR